MEWTLSHSGQEWQCINRLCSKPWKRASLWDPHSHPEEAAERDVSVVMSDCPDSVRYYYPQEKSNYSGTSLGRAPKRDFCAPYSTYPESPRPLAKTTTLVRAISETWLQYRAAISGCSLMSNRSGQFVLSAPTLFAHSVGVRNLRSIGY